MLKIYKCLFYGLQLLTLMAVENLWIQSAGSFPDITEEITPESTEFTIFIIGLNAGRRNVKTGVFVRGAATDSEVINFGDWLIPYDEVLQVLQFTSTVISDNEVELRSPFKIVRINLDEIRNDPELGLVLSVQDIQDLFDIKSEFSFREYAIIFDVPEVRRGRRASRERPPVIVEGLPEISPPNFNIGMVEQRINLTKNQGFDLNNTGRLSAVGTVLDSSWFLRLNQGDITDSQTWRLSEFQIIRQTESSDYFLGSQRRFWRDQRTGGDFWGFTTIQRRGYSPSSLLGSGAANPSQRLQPEQVTATVTGNAEPGTLAQLVSSRYRGEVIAEQFVDNSGFYRFNNVPVGRQVGRNYYVLLYPGGSLISEPKIEEARFTILPEQLPQGASALVISGGLQRRFNRGDDFWGEFTEFNAGVSQRWGITEDLTVGLGGIYDSSTRGLAEVFYQPKGTPLRVGVSGFLGDDVNITTDIVWDSRQFYATFNSDFDRTWYSLNWRLLRGLTLFGSGDLDTSSSLGLQYFRGRRNFSTNIRVSVDTDETLNWHLNQRLGDFYLFHRGFNIPLGSTNSGSRDSRTNSSLSYRWDANNSIFLNYDTINTTRSSQSGDNLLTAYWSYRSPVRTAFGELLWQFELGYGVGSQGHGLYSTLGTTIIPGVLLQARYEGVSLTSDQNRLSLQLVSSLGLQQGISPGHRRIDRMRQQGGLLVQPFYDLNNNGKLDAGEEIYADSSEFLIIDNELVRPTQMIWHYGRFLVHLNPGMYRVDLDPAGFPPDFQPLETAFAVQVVEGSYTPILIPLAASYTIAGVITNAEGEPILGARVEAFDNDGRSASLSITNAAGVYYLEQLRPGTYQLKVNGRSQVQPNTITIDENSETLEELNIQLLD
nr:carboxypeptidase-like regulatory domain-containing protein [Arthrospira sp. SH-MAG29]